MQGIAGYSTREVSEVLGLPTSTILAWTRSGLLSPQRDHRGAYVFSFQDISVLRAARTLLDADVSPRRVKQTLATLREQLPAGRPLSAVHLAARDGRVLVREEDHTWEPDTGQLEMSLEGGASPAQGVAGASPDDDTTPTVPLHKTVPARDLDADKLFDEALDLEGTDVPGAMTAYARILDMEPGHADAHLNLGRLLHEDGRVAEAETHYRAALAADAGNARAAYNLGVALEDQGRATDAEAAYQRALALDPDLAVAHYNLSRLCEATGRQSDALNHLASYKRLLDGGAAD